MRAEGVRLPVILYHQRILGKAISIRTCQLSIETMISLQETYGIHSFNLVHDNVTASPHKVKELCEQIISSGLSCEWRCSARPDSVDNQLLGLMYKAGCRGMFMGIESGSPVFRDSAAKK